MLERRFREALARLEAQGLRRRLEPLPEGLLNLSGNDYLGLARDPRLLEAARGAAERWGFSLASSPLVAGYTPLHEALEEDLKDLYGAEAALLFPTGYQANLALLAALPQEGDLLLLDAYAHASLHDGARLARAERRRFSHGDLEALEGLLRTARGQPFVVVDGVYSMDGDFAPLLELKALADRYGAYLIVDDAHGALVTGEGRGSLARFGLAPGENLFVTGSLSKAFAALGGYLLGPLWLRDHLLQRGRGFIYSTALPPPAVAAARAALALAQSEPWRRARLLAHVRRLREGLKVLGARVLGEEGAPLLALLAGEAQAALALEAALRARGVFVRAIRPPSVPEGMSRIRLSPSAALGEREVEEVLAAFREVLGHPATRSG